MERERKRQTDVEDGEREREREREIQFLIYEGNRYKDVHIFTSSRRPNKGLLILDLIIHVHIF